ncbi:MAG: polar amino acid transport system substrate-binding protein [Alteromonadaceae bacterium]|jgi:polar amino acid transport system substrate-binding protein
MLRNYFTTNLATIISLILLIISPDASAAKLNIVTLEYPPYAYEEGKKVKGVAVDIVTEALKRMGLPFSITVLPWARALHQIKNGDADAIFTLFKTPEREVFADYSHQTLIAQIVSLYVKKDSSIEFTGDFKKLASYSFGLVRKVSYGEIFDRAVNEKVITNTVRSNDAQQSFKMLFSNRVDIIAINKYGALDILQKTNKLKDIKELKPELQNIPSYIAFSKKRNLKSIRDQFDDTLLQMKKDGTYEKLLTAIFVQ